MRAIWKTLPWALCALFLSAGLAGADVPSKVSQEIATFDAFRAVVDKTAGMVGDPAVGALAAKHGLNVVNVTWEDTGRFKGSAVGPNISDMTLQVQEMDPRTEQFRLTALPVIRFPNFEDKSADLTPDQFWLLVGNEKGKDLKRVTLKELLSDLRAHLSKPGSWGGKRTSLLADRDKHVLVSAQACFLPVPKGGKVEFNPVLFNYQSVQGDPAVLTILATREGTSVTIIDNTRDAFLAGPTWGQRLFFNQNGERASLTGERLSDFTAREAAESPKEGHEGAPATAEAAGQQGLNMVLLIQVPLKQKNPMERMTAMPAPSAAPMDDGAVEEEGDVEEAVIGHGKVEGPFTEIDGLDIERDERFPVRVTVQFYKATSNGVVTEEDMAGLEAQIDRVYEDAAYVGSLVTEGETGRPTEHHGPKVEPPEWWEAFWLRHLENTGMSREETLQLLRKRLGHVPRSPEEAEGALSK